MVAFMIECKPYEIYAVRYAENPFSMASQVFLGGETPDVPMPLDYFIWLIVGNGRQYVVDTGFKNHIAQKRNRQYLHCPTYGLSRLGISASDIKDVLITHLHYDHAGNLDLFPNACIHVQEREVQFTTGRSICSPAISHIFEEEDIVHMVRRVFRGQVFYQEGSAEIAPGISVHLIGGHTPGLQAVRVRTARGWVVLASDAAHFYKNIFQRKPFAWSVHLDDVFKGYSLLRKLADSDDHIIPGHDPLVMSQYPAPSSELEGVVVQLHVPPKFSAMKYC